jgi:hypothetical protein
MIWRKTCHNHQILSFCQTQPAKLLHLVLLLAFLNFVVPSPTLARLPHKRLPISGVDRKGRARLAHAPLTLRQHDHSRKPPLLLVPARHVSSMFHSHGWLEQLHQNVLLTRSQVREAALSAYRTSSFDK